MPDGRAYELVTPAETGGYVPTMNELGGPYLGAGTNLATDFAATGGNALVFGIEGGSLPGLPGNGFHDTYEARREAIGPYGHWSSESTGIDGTDAWYPSPGGFGPTTRQRSGPCRKNRTPRLPKAPTSAARAGRSTQNAPPARESTSN